MDEFSRNVTSVTGLTPNNKQLGQFERYLKLLIEWNQKINLTAIRERDEIVCKHFLDSLTIIPIIGNQPTCRLIDVGTGAGFPGIPLKIMLPDLKLSLVEATGKKARFCQLVVDELELKDVTVITDRAEELGRQSAYREMYDVVTARAVAALPILLEYLIPLAIPGGLVVAQKGDTAADEINRASNALLILGGDILENRKVTIPGLMDERFLVLIRKNRHTPGEYPRHGGTITKHPL